MRHLFLCLLLLGPATAVNGQEDLRELYDVHTYRLDLRVQPEARRLSGTVGIRAEVVGDELSTFQLDLTSRLQVVRGRRPTRHLPLHEWSW